MRPQLPFLLGSTLVAGVLVGARPAQAATASPWSVNVQFTAPTVCHDGREFPQPYSTPAAGDLRGDGQKEIVVGLPDGSVRVYDSRGTQLWTRDTGDAVAASPTLADLDGNGSLSVIVSSYSGRVYVWDANGNLRPGWPQSSQFGSYGGAVQPGFFSSVAVGDAFANGRKELFASALDQHTYAWYADGSPVNGWPKTVFDSALATPLLVDLEHAHRLDEIAPSDSSGGAPGPNGPYAPGAIYWGWRPDGSQIGATAALNPDQVPWSSPVAEDLLGNGVIDIVNGTGDFFPNKGLRLDGFAQNGSIAIGFPHGTTAPTFASPATGDLLGDGHREVVEVDEHGVLYALLGDGSAATGFPLQLPTNAFSEGGMFHGGPAIAPVDGSGRSNGVWVADGGHLLGYSSRGVLLADLLANSDGPTIYSTPTVADLGHGSLSIVALAQHNDNGSNGPVCGTTNTYHLVVHDIPGSGTSLPAWSWPTFHGNMQRTGSNLPLAPPPVPPAHGYWLAATDGGIFPFGNAVGWGSTGGIHLNQPIVGLAATPGGAGYWLVASDGGIFPFGNATGWGSTGGIHLNQPIVGMASTPDGGGYWLVARDGGIFPFGNAGGFGSTGGIHLNSPIVGMAATPSGQGYWLVASDGGIFPFGDAGGYGSTGGIHLNQPIVGMARTRDGGGYWLVASDGGIFPFGDAGGYGSTGGIHLNRPIVAMTPSFDGLGYYLVASDGGIFPFGDAPGYGSTGGIHLNQPIVTMAVSS